MKVIQLRGTNATGKTTAVRELINHGAFTVKTIRYMSRDIEYHWEETRRIAIIGRYDKRTTGGVDGYITDKDVLRGLILRLIKEVKPADIIFEGVVYGVTCKFAWELSVVLKSIGAEYIGLCFNPPLDVVFTRLAERNGDKAVDYMSVQNKWFTANRAIEMLQKRGVNVINIDTSRIPKESMYKLIEDVL